MSNWTEDRENQLIEIVGNESPVSRETVEAAAEALEVSTRSISSKLRKMEYDVEKAGARAKRFTDEQEEALRDLVENNAGVYTFAEIAERFENGAFTSKQIQGKILSMELNDAIAPAPEVVVHMSLRA